MSKNICPCCKGKAEYKDCLNETSNFICAGCEIKNYSRLHEIMNKLYCDKETAFNKMKGSE